MILWWHQGTSGAIRRYFSDTSVPVKQSRDTVVTLGYPVEPPRDTTVGLGYRRSHQEKL